MTWIENRSQGMMNAIPRVCLIGLLLCSNMVLAQPDGARKVFQPSVATRAEFQTWSRTPGSGEATDVSQFVLPISAKYPLADSIALDLLSTTIASPSDEGSLSGFRDVKARAVVMLAHETVMLSAGVNLPTGNSALDTEKLVVSRLLADRAMGFRYSNLGEGFDIHLNASTARKVVGIVLGGGLGYLRKGEYEFLEETGTTYQPGDRITATAGVDVPLRPLLLRVDATYTLYGTDMRDGNEVYQEESQLAIQMNGSLVTPRLHALVAIGYVLPGTPKSLQGATLEETTALYGNYLDLKALIRIPLTQAFWLKGTAELSQLSENAIGANDASVVGLGAGVGYQVTHSSNLSLEGSYYTGSADAGSTTLNGLRGIASLWWAF